MLPDCALLKTHRPSPQFQPHQPSNMRSSNASYSRRPSTSPSQRMYPSVAFSGVMNVPFKSPISPPSTTSTPYQMSPVSSTSSSSSSSSIASASPRSSVSGKSFASTAYPDWPKREILSPLASFCGSQASSHISDEDLLDLEHLELCDDFRIPAEKTAGISWEATKQPPVVLQSAYTQQPKSRPSSKRRRRSSPLNKKKATLGMTPIAEGPE